MRIFTDKNQYQLIVFQTSLLLKKVKLTIIEWF